MPFTISHAMAVLPLVRPRWSRRFIPAALVIGSWIPDLPYFVPPHRGSGWSHAVSGPFTIDLGLGLAAFALWRGVLQRPLSALAPPWLTRRLPAARGLELRRAPWVIMSVTVGALTHVVWDTFTHHDRWGTTRVTALNTILAGLPLYKWLQFGSGAVGLVALALWCARWLHRAEPHPIPAAPRRIRQLAWMVIIATLIGSFGVTAVLGSARSLSLEAAAFRIATTTMAAVAGAVVMVALLWHAIRPLTAGSVINRDG